MLLFSLVFAAFLVTPMPLYIDVVNVLFVFFYSMFCLVFTAFLVTPMPDYIDVVDALLVFF